MADDYQQLDDCFLALRMELRTSLTSDEIGEFMHFVDHDEDGIALETLVATLEEHPRPIGVQAFRLMKRLSVLMELQDWFDQQSFLPPLAHLT